MRTREWSAMDVRQRLASSTLLVVLTIGVLHCTAGPPSGIGKYRPGTSPPRPPARTPRTTCVCAFDFDLTLRVISRDGRNSDQPAKDARNVIAGCKSQGCGIAVASANNNRAKLTSVLPKVDPSTFTQSFFQSAAFQYGQSYKASELEKIADYFGQPPKRCMVLFDDQWKNKQYADKVGSFFEKVDPNVGVSWSNFYHAMKNIKAGGKC